MTNQYSSEGTGYSSPKKDNKSNIIIILGIALVGSWIFFFYARHQSNSLIAEKDAQYAVLDSTRNSVQKEYDEAVIRLEDLTASNTSLDSLVKSRNQELDILKDKFRGLIRKQNATAADLSEAKKLVRELNGKIDDYIAQIDQLKAENKSLTSERNKLSADNKTLSSNLASSEAAKREAENKVDIGSTLNASKFTIAAVKERNSGKERTTSSAKRADKLRISFYLDENRIATTGTKQLYIIAKDPSGKIIKEEALGSGKFGTREEGTLDYTTKVDVEYKQGESKFVGFDLRQSERYVKGNYAISVYQNGFKIGEGVAVLK